MTTRNILITGNLGVLASRVAIRHLTCSGSTHIRVVHRDLGELEDFLDCIRASASDFPPNDTIAQSVTSRLGVQVLDFLSEPGPQVQAAPINALPHQVWHFAGADGGPEEISSRKRYLASVLKHVNATELNCVLAPFTHHASHWLTGNNTNDNPQAETLPAAIANLCDRHNTAYRIFVTAMLLDQNQPAGSLVREGLVNFAATLYELKKEIGTRYSDYFQRQPLRYKASADAALNLISAGRAAELMLGIAEQPDTLGRLFYVASPTKTPFSDLCKSLSSTYELTLLPTADVGRLNEIDKLFNRRLSSFEAQLSATDEAELQQFDHLAGENDGIDLNQPERVELLRSLRRSQDAAWLARKERVSAMPGSLNERVIVRNDAPLTYYCAGPPGIPIVLINALGQGLQYWYPLADYLRKRRRVILWEQRGTTVPPYPFPFLDQVSDLEAILENEEAEKCYMAPWCTGLKLSMAFYLLHPGMVQAMTVFNGSLHTFDTPPELETLFEQNFGPVCRIVDQTPRMAASVRSLLTSALEDKDADLFSEFPEEQLGAEVLSRINIDLRPHVVAPFRNETVTVHYCRQILDFKAYDPRPNAALMDVPALFIGSEYDKLTLPAAVAYAAKLFPRGRYLQVPGATHYFLYDQPDVAGELIEKFFFDRQPT
jgi:pimeloyl-ACP methyl ester carboxylesterase